VLARPDQERVRLGFAGAQVSGVATEGRAVNQVLVFSPETATPHHQSTHLLHTRARAHTHSLWRAFPQQNRHVRSGFRRSCCEA
jgi:hypothetical protein